MRCGKSVSVSGSPNTASPLPPFVALPAPPSPLPLNSWPKRGIAARHYTRTAGTADRGRNVALGEFDASIRDRVLYSAWGYLGRPGSRIRPDRRRLTERR